MAAAPQRDFRSIAIDQHISKMFSVVVAGSDYDLPDYEARFAKYQRDAEKLQDVYLQARLQSVQGTMYLTRCHLERAEACYTLARDFYAASGARDRSIGMESNLALLKMQRGRYAESVELFHVLMSQKDEIGIAIYGNLAVNLGFVLVASFAFEEALAVIEPMLINYGEMLESLRTHAHDGVFVSEQRVYLGMAQLGVGQVKQAIDSARLAADIVRHVNTPYVHVLSLSLLMRLAAGGHIPDSPALLMERIDAVMPMPGDLYTFCQLREEARYYLHTGTLDLARWFGERSLAMAERLDSDELIANARTIMAPTG